jgi:uncharacterized protein (UPF0276 family)
VHHYAGGRQRDGLLIDSHDAATSDAVWRSRSRCRPCAGRAVILERDLENPPLANSSMVARARRAS